MSIVPTCNILVATQQPESTNFLVHDQYGELYAEIHGPSDNHVVFMLNTIVTGNGGTLLHYNCLPFTGEYTTYIFVVEY